MTERLLQFIWQYQYFSSKEIVTEEGEYLQIIHPGSLNKNQGPDFLDAKIKINDITWAGSIEVHIKSAHWKTHKHSQDKNYQNVILHVVWHNDTRLNHPFSTLELQDKVPKLLLHKYGEMMQPVSFIPCEKQIGRIDKLTWQSWKERLLIERLEQRTGMIFDYLQKSNTNWEETCWWLIARNFGVNLNSMAFEKIAQSVPLHILARHKTQIHQVEGMLFGQAGLLDREFEESYPKMLQKEYLFLKKKYKLKKVEASLIFLRMRPSNFPTVRLAQLAMLVHKSQHLFSKIKESGDIKSLKQLLQVTANDYWHYHYVFDEISTFKRKKPGEQMINNILINTIVPLVFAYGHYHSEPDHKEKALHWLDVVAGEKNNITKGFTELQVQPRSAFDSQALIQLKNEYCNSKRCLDCSIGNKLLRNDQYIP